MDVCSVYNNLIDNSQQTAADSQKFDDVMSTNNLFNLQDRDLSQNSEQNLSNTTFSNNIVTSTPQASVSQSHLDTLYYKNANMGQNSRFYDRAKSERQIINIEAKKVLKQKLDKLTGKPVFGRSVSFKNLKRSVSSVFNLKLLKDQESDMDVEENHANKMEKNSDNDPNKYFQLALETPQDDIEEAENELDILDEPNLNLNSLQVLFGNLNKNKIENQLSPENIKVINILKQLCNVLYENRYQEGLIRIPGNSGRIDDYLQLIESNMEKHIEWDKMQATDAAGVIKKLFRYNSSYRVFHSGTIENFLTIMDEFYQENNGIQFSSKAKSMIINYALTLKRANHLILLGLLRTLNSIIQCDQNSMNTNSVAVCFALTLFTEDNPEPKSFMSRHATNRSEAGKRKALLTNMILEVMLKMFQENENVFSIIPKELETGIRSHFTNSQTENSFRTIMKGKKKKLTNQLNRIRIHNLGGPADTYKKPKEPYQINKRPRSHKTLNLDGISSSTENFHTISSKKWNSKKKVDDIEDMINLIHRQINIKNEINQYNYSLKQNEDILLSQLQTSANTSKFENQINDSNNNPYSNLLYDISSSHV